MEEIARWQLLEKPIEAIADLMGMTPDAISEIVKHPVYREIRGKLIEEVYEPVDIVIKSRKADVMLHEAAPDAAEALVDLLNSKKTVEVVTDDGIQLVEVPLDPVDVRLTATAILDRSGYGPIQRKHVRQRLEIDPLLVKLLSAAMKESDVRIIDAELIEDTEVPPKPGVHDGVGGQPKSLEVPTGAGRDEEAERLSAEPDEGFEADGEEQADQDAGNSVGVQ